MVAPEDLGALLTEPYRVACPRGHTALVPAETTASAFCRTCGRAYEARELVDKHRDRPDAGNRGRHDNR